MVSYHQQSQARDLSFKIYGELYEFFGHPLLFIGKRVRNQRLTIAAAHYDYDPEKAASCAIGFSTLMLLATLTLLAPLSLLSFYYLLLVITTSLVTACITFLHTINFLPNKLKEEELTITSHASTILREIYFVLTSSNSVLDVLLTIGTGEYPYVSESFATILHRTSNGEDPERLIREYLERQPSEVFRNGCRDLLFTKNLEHNTALNTMELAERDARGYFMKFVRQIEDRLSVLLAVTFFFPIIFVFIALGLDLLPNYWVLAFAVPAFTLFVDVLYSNLLKINIRLLG